MSALAVLPDGRLASASDDKTIKLWNLQAQRYDATLEGHASAVTALAVLPDGRLASIASGRQHCDCGRSRGRDPPRGCRRVESSIAMTMIDAKLCHF